MRGISPFSGQHVVHVTSIPCGKWTWTLEKYWDVRTMDAFLLISQNWFWQLAQASPFMRSKSDSSGPKRFSWVLKANQSNIQEQAEGASTEFWAQAQSHFRHFVSFRLFIGRFDGYPAHIEEDVETWVFALITGLFLTSQCDFINVVVVDPDLENRLAKLFPAPHKLNVFPKGCEYGGSVSPSVSPRIEINEYCLPRTPWLAEERSQSYEREHRYLRSRFEMAKGAEQRRLRPVGPRRQSFWKRLLGLRPH